MVQKKLTKEQLDRLEAVANEFIDRGHLKSLDPRDDRESFKKKLKRDLDKQRKKIAEGLMDEDHERKRGAEETIVFGFENDESEKEFEAKVRTIFPDPKTAQKEHRVEEELGSSWSSTMTAQKAWYGSYYRYDIGAYTSASGLLPNRLVAQVNLLDPITLAQLQHWKTEVEPGTSVSVRHTAWGIGMHWGTRHVIYYNNWGTSLTRRYHVSQEGPWSIDGISEF
jgi:hypothetical protein